MLSMSLLFILSHVVSLCHCVRPIIDYRESFSNPILCGSEVLIQHRASDLCLTMSTNEYYTSVYQIGLRDCYENDITQQWIIHCCDKYLLRCGPYNPSINNESTLTYDHYFQLQQKVKKLCISTASLWSNGESNQSVYLQQCQLSLLSADDSIESMKIQRDKFSFNDDHENGNVEVATNHFTKFINLYHPLCLGCDDIIKGTTDMLLKGYDCSVPKADRILLQFKFIPLENTQDIADHNDL